MFVDRFDAEYCGKAALLLEGLMLKSYSSIVLSEESKKRILDLGTSSIIYASLHKSHFDYISICVKHVLEGLGCPRTVAGRNLLSGITGKVTKLLTRIDMMKWGAVPIKRGSSVSRDLFEVCSKIEEFLKSDKPILTFPETEMIKIGEKLSVKTGRTYSGRIRKFASGLFNAAINVSKEGKKVYIVPVSVSYDFVAEDRYFSKLAKADKMKKSGSALTAFAGKLYYTFLEFHFYWNMYRLGKGNIYIDIGQPFLVEPHLSKKELAQRAQEEAARCSRITMPALVSYVISKGATKKNELQLSMERYVALLNRKNINFHLSMGPEESIDKSLHDLEERKIISCHNDISVKNQQMINYYANTIAHHFEHLG